MRVSWRNFRPTSLRDALRACKDCARERHNRSVEQIADLMGESADNLYKWLSNGRMPAVLIPTYELACDSHFVTDWLAASAGRLTIAIPVGKAATPTDMQRLQEVLHGATGALLAFHAGTNTPEMTQAALMSAMSALGWHHHNVGKHEQPELELS